MVRAAHISLPAAFVILTRLHYSIHINMSAPAATNPEDAAKAAAAAFDVALSECGVMIIRRWSRTNLKVVFANSQVQDCR